MQTGQGRAYSGKGMKLLDIPFYGVEGGAPQMYCSAAQVALGQQLVVHGSILRRKACSAK
mgnify:FL=1